MLLQKPVHKGRDLKHSRNTTRRQSAYTRTRSTDTDTEEHQRLVNDQRKAVQWNSPKVNLIDSEGDIIPKLSTQDSSSN